MKNVFVPTLFFLNEKQNNKKDSDNCIFIVLGVYRDPLKPWTLYHTYYDNIEI